eukprot:TRINITY_DN10414_c0_g1_i1.p1 TRINITY_DN10414_c0_g1~~TRINITY_DN10414_c0_g1_i1.p1  ORF type:complete len:226 (-),score=31.89 TRINITY_DN10414_c0_g1_i1:227-904(-)
MYHFINVLLLTYIVYYVIYKAKLAELKPFAACSLAALGFLATQGIKMFLVATFLPAFDVATGFNWTSELLKVLSNVLDIVGVHFTLKLQAMNRFAASDRLLIVSIGWSFAEALLTNLIPFWMGARGMEFSWEYIQMAITSNLNILLILGFVTAVFLRSRTDLDPSSKAPVFATFALYLILPSMCGLLISLKWNEWLVLLLRAALSFVSAFGMRKLLTSYQLQKQD